MPFSLDFSDPVISKLIGSVVAGILGNIFQSIAQYLNGRRAARKLQTPDDFMDNFSGALLIGLFFTMISFSVGPVVIALGIQAQILTGNANYLYVSMAGMVFLVIFIIRSIAQFERGQAIGRRLVRQSQLQGPRIVDED